MMLAESIANNINWTLIATVVMAVGTVGMWLDSRKQHTQQVMVNGQPLSVEIVKALHDQFADRSVFEKHVSENSERHGLLFKLVDQAERTARRELAEAVNGINTDRAKTMQSLTENLAFIRESLAAINRELELKRKNNPS